MNEEIFPIVDENDNIIGAKPRKDVLETDIFRVAALMLINEKGEFLLQKRHASKKASPNLWAPSCAGHVQQGETYEDAIRREASEEIDAKLLLSIVPYEKFFRESVTLDTGIFRRRFSQGFVSIYDTTNMPPLAPDGVEVSEIRWISPSALQKELADSPEKFIGNMSEIVASIGSFLANHPDFLKSDKKEKP